MTSILGIARPSSNTLGVSLLLYEVDQMVKEMLDQGVVVHSKCPWASPVVLVAKKDGSTHFCVDYRRLNAVTKSDIFPLPRVDDSLD